MKETASIFKLFSDVTRLRLLMLLSRSELCVCQLMGILGVSQPLVSRNLAMLTNAGLLDERRDGKLMFFKVKADLSPELATIMKLVKKMLKDDAIFTLDLGSLSDCMDFQKKAGKCDMKTFLEFMERQKANKAKA